MHKIALILLVAALGTGASLTAERHWVDRESGLSMTLAEGFAPGPASPDAEAGLSVESSDGGVYRTCSARVGPDGEEVAATIRELGGDPQWVRSVCEDTAYPPGQRLENRTYLVGASDDTELGARHSCIVAYDVDDAELRGLGLSHVMRQASVMTAGPRTVILNCSLAARDAKTAIAHWPAAEEAFGAMRGSISYPRTGE